ncbi:MAG TPA: CBS domain-containing protein [Pseudonocardia sp.]|jgi:CBS domain-containing protein
MTVARDIMTPDVSCVGSTDSVSDAAATMAKLGVGSLPIVSGDGALIGVLTDRDIVVRVLAEGNDPNRVRASELAQGDVVTIGADDDVADLLQTMARHRVRRLPVLDHGTLVGVVALADVARAVSGPAGLVLEAVSER